MSESAAKIRVKKKFQALSAGQPCAVCQAMYKRDLCRFVKQATCRHHIIHRGSQFLFGDWRNGINVCQECHNKIHSQAGFANWVHDHVVGPQVMDLLYELARTDFKQHLLIHGISADEFWKIQEKNLDEQLKHSVRYGCFGADVSDIPF